MDLDNCGHAAAYIIHLAKTLEEVIPPVMRPEAARRLMFERIEELRAGERDEFDEEGGLELAVDILLSWAQTLPVEGPETTTEELREAILGWFEAAA